MVNTFDLDLINERLIAEALRRLKPGGFLVVGWNSDFSGRAVEGWSHWPVQMLRQMKETCGLSAPIVAEVPALLLSRCMIRAAYLSGRSIPVFMARRNSTQGTI